MATVYKAFDPTFERQVAIKVLHSEYLHDPQFRLRFEREARTIAALEHIAIVPVYDFGQEKNQLFLVMRYMSGGSLKSKIQSNPLTFKQSTAIFSHLAPALDFAHKKGVIHRDIKPDNILFDEHGGSFLSDFGLVKLTEDVSLSTDGIVIGTPSYMSPEQIRGEGEVTSKSDIYALGATLYESLTGVPPFIANTNLGVAMKHLKDPVPNIRLFRSDLSSHVQEVINVAMAKSPTDRFHSASQFAAALNQPEFTSHIIVAESNGTTTDGPAVSTDTLADSDDLGTETPTAPTLSSISTRFSWPNLLSISLVGLTIFVFTLGSILLSRLNFSRTGSPTVVPTTLAEADSSDSGSNPHFESDNGQALAEVASPTQIGLASTEARATIEVSPLIQPTTPSVIVPSTVIPTDTAEPPPFATATPFTAVRSQGQKSNQLGFGRINDIAVSPKESIYVVASTTGIYLVDLDTNDLRFSLALQDSVTAVAFSNNGELFAAGSAKGFEIWNTANGTLVNNARGNFTDVKRLAFGPNDRSLISSHGDNRVREWSFETRQEFVYAEIEGELDDMAVSPTGQFVSGGTDSGTLIIWDRASREIHKQLDVGDAAISQIQFSPDGRFIAAGSADRSVKIFNLTAEEPITQFDGLDLETPGLIFSPNSQTIWVGGDNKIQSFIIESGFKADEFALPAGKIFSLGLSFSGDNLIAGGAKIHAVNLRNQSTVDSPLPFTPPVSSLVIDTENQSVIIGYENGDLTRWDQSTNSMQNELTGLHTTIGAMAPNPAGNDFALAANKDIFILDRLDLTEKLRLRGHQSAVTHLAYHPSGSWLASGSADTEIRIWDLAEQETSLVFAQHSAPIVALATAPNRDELTSASEAGELFTWSPSTGRILSTIQNQTAPVTDLLYSSDGNLLAVAYADQKIMLWQRSSGNGVFEQIQELEGSTPIQFGPSDIFFFSDKDGKAFVMWDLSKNEVIASQFAHNEPITALIFDEPSNTLFSGSQDGTVLIWRDLR